MFCSYLEDKEEKLFSVWTDGEFSKKSYDCSKSGIFKAFQKHFRNAMNFNSTVGVCIIVSSF